MSNLKLDNSNPVTVSILTDVNAGQIGTVEIVCLHETLCKNELPIDLI